MDQLTAPTAQDEAEAIALIMRHAAEMPGRTAALVSPDRLLARRVAVRLESWGIRVDDSAGRPFVKTVPGAFLDLVIEIFQQNFAPAALMALLKHPLTRIGRPVLEIRRAARALEVAAFRAPYIGAGLDGVRPRWSGRTQLIEKGERRDRAGDRLRPEDWAAGTELIEATSSRRSRRCGAQGGGDACMRLPDLAEAHLATGEALARLPDVGDKATATAARRQAERRDGGERAVARRSRAGGGAPVCLPDRPLDHGAEVRADSYPDFYRALIAGEAVRSLIPVHPRLVDLGAVRGATAAARHRHSRLAQ